MVDIVNNTQVFNVSISVPDNLLVVSKGEYLDLLRKTDEGQCWSIDEAVKLLGFSKTKIINDILLNPRFKKELDIADKMSIAGIRHTYGSYLLANKVDIWVVAKILGHKDIQQSIETYGHLLQEIEKEGYQEIRELLVINKKV
ncbi:hypothetical protein BVE84_01190 [Streptococcus azizii]|uniref:Tyr recombinase domain-containing protein n=1 Tax=Streptococcus azizii TaxID=1579424 RepID=A0AB36JNU0_9STRE|nr:MULTISPECIES: DUF771 domain-containing protein [Streptococcus]MBF0776032.1 DUF771 domain-containing protein [Streptococcus sp. 19428wD3_AN2]ONK28857.1 hypothetical protein BVE86_01885 [Streptococcus azizii]ONK30368.1 hypothetical protein BVE85_00120 [Streptococcus azizii]ONK31152.1 hypothetical protein BVE84_01190 [Streptococcus azizii]TFU83597.1 DUF771 domain-containing protein [Streptococcus sp. AN2]